MLYVHTLLLKVIDTDPFWRIASALTAILKSASPPPFIAFRCAALEYSKPMNSEGSLAAIGRARDLRTILIAWSVGYKDRIRKGDSCKIYYNYWKGC